MPTVPCGGVVVIIAVGGVAHVVLTVFAAPFFPLAKPWRVASDVGR
jgi:hypothetical protein